MAELDLGPDLNAADRDELAALVRDIAVVHGKVTLSSGKEADYYVDLRRATLHHRAGALIGRLVRELTADWDYLKRGWPDPGGRSGCRRRHACAGAAHRCVRGAQVCENSWYATTYRGIRCRRAAGPGGGGHQHHGRVRAHRGACGAPGRGEVIGVATVVDRDTGAAEAIRAEGVPYRYVLGLADLGLAGS